MKQYYQIVVYSVPYSMDPLKLIFNNFGELKEYVQGDIKYYIREYPLTKWLKDKYQISKVYKRINIDKIQEYDEQNKGYRFVIYFKDTKGDYNEYIEYYCYRVTKKDMWKYSGFKELN